MFAKLKEILFEILFGDCDNCKNNNNCSHIELGGGHCWDNPFEPHYENLVD